MGIYTKEGAINCAVCTKEIFPNGRVSVEVRFKGAPRAWKAFCEKFDEMREEGEGVDKGGKKEEEEEECKGLDGREKDAYEHVKEDSNAAKKVDVCVIM